MTTRFERRYERRDTAANWAVANPVLHVGEWGYDTTNKIAKIGDGTTAWADLGLVNVDALEDLFQDREPQLVQFKKIAGVDATGATATGNDAALAQLITQASTSNPLVVDMGVGTYRFDQPWGSIDSTVLQFVGRGSFFTIIDATHLSTGPFVTIAKPNGENRWHQPISNMAILGPTSPSTTVDGVWLGGGTKYANMVEFHLLRMDGFKRQFVMDDNAYLVHWNNCAFRVPAVNAIDFSVGDSNCGEGMRIFGGTIFGCLGTALNLNPQNATSGLVVDVFGTSFDYNSRVAKVKASSLQLHGCYFELDNTVPAATESIELDVTGLYAGYVSINGGEFTPLNSGTSDHTTFVRLTGTEQGGSVQPTVKVNGLRILNDPRNNTSGQISYLVYDGSTSAPASVSSSTESNIIIDDLSYRLSNGSLGAYYPWRYRDRAARVHLLHAGQKYGNIHYGSQIGPLWALPKVHQWETMPRVMAKDLYAPASGDLLIVRLPMPGTGAPFTTLDLKWAIGDVGATLSIATCCTYSGGNEGAPLTTINKATGNATSTLFTTGADAIKTSTQSITNAFAYPRSIMFAAFLFVGTTPPQLRGIDHGRASPLLDFNNTHSFQSNAAVKAGQSSFPSTLDLTTFTPARFVPWVMLKPGTYA